VFLRLQGIGFMKNTTTILAYITTKILAVFQNGGPRKTESEPKKAE
jgi:hypothetical protein